MDEQSCSLQADAGDTHGDVMRVSDGFESGLPSAAEEEKSLQLSEGAKLSLKLPFFFYGSSDVTVSQH